MEPAPCPTLRQPKNEALPRHNKLSASKHCKFRHLEDGNVFRWKKSWYKSFYHPTTPRHLFSSPQHKVQTIRAMEDEKEKKLGRATDFSLLSTATLITIRSLDSLL